MPLKVFLMELARVRFMAVTAPNPTMAATRAYSIMS